jgi:hypothetical protein
MVLYLAGSHLSWPQAWPTTAGGVCVTVEGKRNGEGQKHVSINPFMQRRGSVTQLDKYFVEIEK